MSNQNNAKPSCANCTNCGCSNAATTKNTEQQLVVTMPDGSQWAVPVRVIADHHAKHYAHQYADDAHAALNFKTGPLFDSDRQAIVDWAEGSMNWEDVKAHAVQLHSANFIDYQVGWVNGDKHFLARIQSPKVHDAAV